MRGWIILAFCTRCGREFYTASSARKFCDVPTCKGYLHHVDRSGGGNG